MELFQKADIIKIDVYFEINRDELETFIEQLDPFIERIIKKENIGLQKKLRKLRILRETSSEEWTTIKKIYHKAKRKGYKTNGGEKSYKTFFRDILELKTEGYLELRKKKGQWEAVRDDQKIYEIEE